MSNLPYSREELEILEFIENKKPESIPNVSSEIDQLKVSVKNKLNKRKAINLRLLETDLEQIKTEAIKDGIPYQTLISSIIHKYINGSFAK